MLLISFLTFDVNPQNVLCVFLIPFTIKLDSQSKMLTGH